MADHQHDANATNLWRYFQDVITWTQSTFTNYRKEIKGIDLGLLYNKYKDDVIDTDALEIRIKELMQDDDVTSKKGVFTYVLTGEEKYLNIRAFTANQRREAYEKQNGICPVCQEQFKLEEWMQITLLNGLIMVKQYLIIAECYVLKITVVLLNLQI